MGLVARGWWYFEEKWMKYKIGEANGKLTKYLMYYSNSIMHSHHGYGFCCCCNT
ncbi:hypothetical protein [Acinetobacter phage Ab69]|nr:hypothetical protein [Acinetobacter phage Ab69]